MSTIQLKAQIHKYIESLQDENLVQAIHAILDTYVKQNEAIVGYDVNGNPPPRPRLQRGCLRSAFAMH